MSVYAESSAVLAWLLDEPSAADVRRLLSAADAVVASDLTVIECDRVLLRAVAVGELSEAEAADRRAHLTMAAVHWHILRIGPEIGERARQPFPGEPIRTLDAIHLASVLVLDRPLQDSSCSPSMSGLETRRGDWASGSGRIRLPRSADELRATAKGRSRGSQRWRLRACV